MLNRFLSSLCVLLLCCTSTVAQEEVRVVVLPFEVHAPERVDDLKEQIRENPPTVPTPPPYPDKSFKKGQ